MTKELIGAYTKPGASFPGYINARRDGETVTLTVRGDPTEDEGAFICGHDRDRGQLGRCTPGDEHCNNYCNSALEKGPMQDCPKPCKHIIEGKTVTITLPLGAFHAVLAAINGG